MSKHRRRQVIAGLLAGLPMLSRGSGLAAQDVTPDDLNGRHRSPHSNDLEVARQIEALGPKADPASRDRAIAFVEQHPDADHPLILMYLIVALQGRGDALQAAFWYFVWRIRDYPWWIAGDMGDKTSSPSLDQTFRERFIPWLLSDPEATRALMIRAGDFEARAPMYPRRPDWVAESEWNRLVAEGRSKNGDGAMALTPAKIQAIIDARKKNGLHVGPWLAPGAPLHEAWR